MNDAPKTADQHNLPQTGKLELPAIGELKIPSPLDQGPALVNKPPTTLTPPTRQKNKSKDPAVEFLKNLPKPGPRQTPPGSYSLEGLHGSREGVLKAIAVREDIPAEDKVFLCSKIAAVPAEFNHFELHGHQAMPGQAGPAPTKFTWVHDLSIVASVMLL